MHNYKLSLLLFFIFNGINFYGQDISGYWQGVLYQPSSHITYFPYSLQLQQAPNGNVTGTAYTIQPNSIYFVNHSVTGTFSQPLLTYSTQIIAELPEPGYYWCTPKPKLTYNIVSETLIGPWTASGCSPGTIELWRLKIISDTIFCKNQPINLEVTGQNVKWYNNKSLGASNLVAVGNTYSLNIDTTTKFYITQTHYNAESPAIAITITIKRPSASIINHTICAGQTYLGYASAGKYIDTFKVAGGCDSIRTLNLTVLPEIKQTVNHSICAGQSYLGYSSAGKYIDTFKVAGGCDSIRTLNLAVLPEIKQTVNHSICAGQSYLGYSSAGKYIDTFKVAGGCDSIRTLNLAVLPEIKQTVNHSICAGQSYLGYSSAGKYIDTFTVAGGCDSIRTLNLAVLPEIKQTVNHSICTGQSYLGYASAGKYIDTFKVAGGCDSIRTLNLTVLPEIKQTINHSICTGQTYLGYTSTGKYIDTFKIIGGCDSIRTLNLTVLPEIKQIVNHSICTGQTYLGYSSAGKYIDTFKVTGGCDSIRTLNLTVLPEIKQTVNHSICAGQTYLGYSSAGKYIDTFKVSGGCDSIRTLNLTVLPEIKQTVNHSICAGQTYLGYSSAGKYIDTFKVSGGCDSIRTLNLNVLAYPQPYLGTNREICTGDSIILSPGNFDAYLWQDNSDSKYFVAKHSGVYSVNVTNTCGSGRHQITVTEKICNEIFPNTFTPNGDGKNDVFKILNTFNLQQYQLIIYNRWGQKIFETHDYAKGWDGKFNGDVQNPGIYIYHCRYLKNTTIGTIKGSITLLR